jgi:1,2-diacylglycerol 3-alpha-glucosyltransferase
MRIAFFTNCYKPLINGVVSSIVSLKNAYKKKGHNTYIFAPKVEGYNDQEDNVFRYYSVSLTKKVKYPIAIPLSLRANRVIKEFKPDIIHIHHPFVLSMPAIMYAEKLGIPKILTIHTQYERYAYYVSPVPQVITNEAIKMIVASFSSKVDVVTTPSESMKKLINRYNIKKEIVVIPNAIDLNIFQEKDEQTCNNIREQLELSNEDIVLLYVGRISFEKNIDKIIKSLALLKDKNIDKVKLVLVGEGTALNQLKSIVKSVGLEQNVKFVGAVDSETVKSYYQISDLFTFASTSETFGMVIIEALASGVPVLAVRAPGAIDILSDGFDGMLVEDDVSEFSARLELLIKNKDLRKRLAKGAFYTAQRYSIDNISDQMLNLYQRLVQR